MCLLTAAEYNKQVAQLWLKDPRVTLHND